ncbi:FAD/NAD(P)-binding domain-containing protein [Aaosphaeria arxii CBS 175.79]|uniref:FAD/NAD(P)-binding domain-containing protein n=1 Tax=Aaosphaeria arxii CBS 175.79 TaxID=1450172 RepID=A0A6A5X6I2_9PLEO|nr:FAD/NAD(P)-binding domain-containing protein [Aaosphaeria arxii CBS 175.79]KAF2008476.1 FAD/NAD(P)-binding domain-containing protein [Aaosphaeria arxii CBS 175.79]
MASIPVPKEATNGFANGDAVPHYDAIVVGAGFSGITSLHRLRKDGYKVHVFESGKKNIANAHPTAASDFGGVWYWNRYPGARVDSETPFYQLNIPEVYNTWNFTSRFSDHREMREYMAHCDRVLNLRKDVSFNSFVNSAEWDIQKSEWHVKTKNGKQARARWLILGTGLLHRTHTPNFPGIENYKGIVHHSGAWPEETSVKGKKVAVIGAGATAVQIVQELGKEASQLTHLIRRPSYCLPMGQRAFTVEEQRGWRGYYPALFEAAAKSPVGFPTLRCDKKILETPEDEREEYLTELWKTGGFHFQLRNYSDVILDKDANKIVYDFWKRNTRERLTDPKKQQIMAPDEAPYYFGTKRIPLEQDYYEVLNQDNVDIVDLNNNPIVSFTEKGIKLGGEDQEREFDYVVLATGFDSYTGSLTQMGLKSKDGVDIKDVWKDGVKTYLGMMMRGFPNAFMCYSPQAPTPLANGPTILEMQANFICDTISALRAQGVKAIEPTRQAEEEWKAGMNAMSKGTLYPYTSSWWNAGNVPGKTSEFLIYIGGIDMYEKQCRETMTGWKGFEIAAQA